MTRSVAYRREISDACNWHQEEALNSEIYLLYNTGPTGFLLKEEGESKNFKVFLGDVHNCTCSVFKKEKDLCKHICWLLLKKFRIDRNNPLTWQLGLCEREINEVLRGPITKESMKTRQKNNQQKDKHDGGQNDIVQREIGEEDVCPICQDNFMEKRIPVTYCRLSCGNNVHIKCMKIWADHQKSNGETQLKCPLCRENFSTFEMLEQEFRNNKLFKLEKHAIHHGLACDFCKATPINGKCYKCNQCKDFYLCQACFNTDHHKEHLFLFREKDNMKYKKAVRDHVGSNVPLAVMNSLLNRNIQDQDYDLLIQLDQKPNYSKIPEKIIKTWRSERIREGNNLLNPGFQCRVCLREYKLGELVRKLPNCKHKFHADCIDNWLLHSHPTCPIDGLVVWHPNAEEETQSNENPKKQTKISEDSQEKSKLNFEVPVIGLSVKPLITLNKPQPLNKRESNVNLTKFNKILKNRAINSHLINLANTSKTLEITGQNLNSFNVQERFNSASSEPSILHNQVKHLPKLTQNRDHLRKETNSQTRINDFFGIELFGTKPYQLSRVDSLTQNPRQRIDSDVAQKELYYANEDDQEIQEIHDKVNYAPFVVSNNFSFNEKVTINRKAPSLRMHHPPRLQKNSITSADFPSTDNELSVNGRFIEN